MYVRFSVLQRDRDSGYPMGVFMAADELKKSPDTHPDLLARLRKAKMWFNENLPDPWYDGLDVEPRSIFWFKSGASNCIRRAWHLKTILEEGGFLVSNVTCRRPGKILYEDDYQIAAIPFRDTRRRL